MTTHRRQRQDNDYVCVNVAIVTRQHNEQRNIIYIEKYGRIKLHTHGRDSVLVIDDENTNILSYKTSALAMYVKRNEILK